MGMNSSIDDLLRLSALGDRAAFAEFYDATSSQALRLARALCRDEALAEDAVLQAYVTAWRTSPTYVASGDSHAGSWVLAILQEGTRHPAESTRRHGRPHTGQLSPP